MSVSDRRATLARREAERAVGPRYNPRNINAREAAMSVEKVRRWYQIVRVEMATCVAHTNAMELEFNRRVPLLPPAYIWKLRS